MSAIGRSNMAASLLHKLAALAVRPSVSTHGCLFMSRFCSKAWTGPTHGHRLYDQEDGEPREGDVEEKLQALVEEAKRKRKAVKFSILRRKMTPAGAPQRRLTWEAMEQIRYLKQENPQEWSVQRLAEGFSVHPDVIQRVLRSKFVPSPERRMKQNAKVMALLRQQQLPPGAGVPQGRETLPENRASVLLHSGGTEASLVPVFAQTQVARGKGPGLVAKSVSALPALSKESDGSVLTRTSSEEAEDVWDGQVFTEEDLEELREIENVTPAVQVGNDFFDSEGNFLYRI